MEKLFQTAENFEGLNDIFFRSVKQDINDTTSI